MFDNVIEFITQDSSPRNLWCDIQKGHSKVYLRKSQRYVNHCLVKCLDIATIEIDSRYHRQGVLTSLIVEIERTVPTTFDIIYVENVMDKWLVEWFIRQGYRVVDNDEIIKSLYKPVTKSLKVID